MIGGDMGEPLQGCRKIGLSNLGIEKRMRIKEAWKTVVTRIGFRGEYGQKRGKCEGTGGKGV